MNVNDVLLEKDCLLLDFSCILTSACQVCDTQPNRVAKPILGSALPVILDKQSWMNKNGTGWSVQELGSLRT